MTSRASSNVVAVGFIVAAASAAALACDNARPGPVEPAAQPASPSPGFTPVAALGALLGKLPSTDTVTSSVPAFEIKQKGGGIAGRFEITNPNSAAIALDGVHSGTGHALLAWNLGKGRAAVIITSNSTNTLPALDVSSQSLGITGTNPLGAAADIRSNNTSVTGSAVRMSMLGNGVVLEVDHRGTTGNLATFKRSGDTRIRFTRVGKGIFDNGTQTGGADVAEAFEVEGRVSDYEPGDVLVISQRSDRRVAPSEEPYSSHVIGVYATKPGVLLTELGVDDPLDLIVPVAVIGVVPTKVSAENGAIRRGDMLVTAGTPRHVMLGTERDRMLGAVVGKALAEFAGPGTGVIPVLVNVK